MSLVKSYSIVGPFLWQTVVENKKHRTVHLKLGLELLFHVKEYNALLLHSEQQCR